MLVGRLLGVNRRVFRLFSYFHSFFLFSLSYTRENYNSPHSRRVFISRVFNLIVRISTIIIIILSYIHCECLKRTCSNCNVSSLNYISPVRFYFKEHIIRASSSINNPWNPIPILFNLICNFPVSMIRVSSSSALHSCFLHLPNFLDCIRHTIELFHSRFLTYAIWSDARARVPPSFGCICHDGREISRILGGRGCISNGWTP